MSTKKDVRNVNACLLNHFIGLFRFLRRNLFCVCFYETLFYVRCHDKSNTKLSSFYYLSSWERNTEDIGLYSAISNWYIITHEVFWQIELCIGNNVWQFQAHKVPRTMDCLAGYRGSNSKTRSRKEVAFSQ